MEKSVPHDHCLSHSASLVMPKGDPRNGVFCPSLTLMMDFYSVVTQRFYELLGTYLKIKVWTLKMQQKEHIMAVWG